MTLSAYLEVIFYFFIFCYFFCFNLYILSSCWQTVSYLYSWTIASSLLLLPKTSAWCFTPETLRSLLLGPSGTCSGADTPKLLTGIRLQTAIVYQFLWPILKTVSSCYILTVDINRTYSFSLKQSGHWHLRAELVQDVWHWKPRWAIPLLLKDKLPDYRDSSESFILMSDICCEQGCSGGGERCWTHQWLTFVERRTWPAGGPEETVSS